MALADLVGVHFRYREALALGAVVAFAASLLITPRAIRKLRGAGIVGHDRHKPGRPEVAEMGGLAVFIAFNMGAFVLLALGDLERDAQVLVLAGLVVCAGATITGILDDLISLRQRFKAFIPLAFAVPLALYVSDTTLDLPWFGVREFGLVYAVALLPLGVAFASNGFNMLEGFNGLGAGLGIINAVAISAMAMATGHVAGLAVTIPLAGALAGFYVFNGYPARVFPGDTMTLLVGAALAVAAILAKVEFWAALLLLPHLVEFLLKARAGFDAQCFADRVEGDGLHYDGPVRSLAHVVMRLRPGIREPDLVHAFLVGQIGLSGLVLGAFYLLRG